MAQPLTSINLVAPGFKGVNTEDSPLTEDPSFAEVADNTVIDKSGRVASRKGVQILSDNPEILDGNALCTVHYYFEQSGGREEVLSAGNGKIFKGTSTLEDITPAGVTITADDWQVVNFNDKAYFFQIDHEPLVYSFDEGMQTLEQVTGKPTAEVLKCNAVASAYGRLWIADSSTDKQTVYFSDLLIPDFTLATPDSTTGFIDISKYWPDGTDQIVGISAHNNILAIYGKHSIIVYQGASNPVEELSLATADAISGVGCIDRNSIQGIGTDVLFMSYDGLRSLGRVVQERSLPISDLSASVKSEIIKSIELNSGPVKSLYSPENSFYLISFIGTNITFCFDVKTRLENGAFRATRWVSPLFKCFDRTLDGTVFVGTGNGLGIYTGYLDDGESYRLRYYSPALTFGDPSKLKMLKRMTPTLIGSNTAKVSLRWAYDFSEAYSAQSIDLGSSVPNTGYFNESEWNIAEFSGGTAVSRKSINTAGSGTVIVVGLEADIEGEPLSIQEINIQALTGRIL